MARAYYGSKISNNLTLLDNGCLLCLNVPIARTGTYKYMKEELGLDGTGIVDVHREDNEVFDKISIASFEGKPFTDTHPAVDVDVNNWAQYAKGTVSNVRKGTGKDAGYLIADIIVTDPIAISEIKTGVKREISCGYDCEYIERDGKIYQRNIRGNHVALVQHGRAGDSVKIHDERKTLSSKYLFIKKIDKIIKNL